MARADLLRQMEKTITANSAKEQALSIVEVALAKFDGLLANRQLALAA